MSNLIEFAERELRALPGRRDSDRIMLERDVVALVGLFDAQRHSGASARFVVSALTRLLRWQTLDAAENDPAPTDAERQRDHYAAVLRNAVVVMEARKTCPKLRRAILQVLEPSPLASRSLTHTQGIA
ncbi:hypothetical protein [Methylorubrum suomiense]|uniref:Uncharacterized protein n=1 Tax=Methylorubrum suomiense TaxID=144191 RepID=A0ABQ4UT81_9HYPH|nr:hypothetical protein [Methylorubrum suomiense]GJE75543.1 hypothetical protein BGCPKDLD_2127 [Methylorubrum suomiense]